MSPRLPSEPGCHKHRRPACLRGRSGWCGHRPSPHRVPHELNSWHLSPGRSCELRPAPLASSLLSRFCLWVETHVPPHRPCCDAVKTWISGTSPVMTAENVGLSPPPRLPRIALAFGIPRTNFVKGICCLTLLRKRAS